MSNGHSHPSPNAASMEPLESLNGRLDGQDSHAGVTKDRSSVGEPNDMTNTHSIDLTLDTSMLDGKVNDPTDSVLNGDPGTAGSTPPDLYTADPMLASAKFSPLSDRPNLDAIASPIGSERVRAPSILSHTNSIADEWELYKRAGPRYPASLDALIMKHHQKHNDSWQLAHDLGAGSGVYCSALARFFRHVHVSDPTEEGINTSRKQLGKGRTADTERRGRFTFSTNAPERAEECMTEESVDLAVLCEAAHFTDAEAVVRSVAKTLVPGGTLAIVTHRPSGRIVGNERAKEAVQKLFTAWGSKPWDLATGTEIKAKQQFALGLDFVPLPEELFDREKTRRITINPHGKASECFRIPDLEEQFTTLSADDQLDIPTSRVGEKEKRHVYGENDEYGKGWRQEVGWESFRTRIALLDSSETVRRLEPYLKEVQDVIGKTSPNGVTVMMEWSAAVVLATRK